MQMNQMKLLVALALAWVLPVGIQLVAGEGSAQRKLIPRPGLFQSLTEPPCSYCSTENRKGLVGDKDRVLAWIRGAHNGGALPLRHLIAAPRVINDTYGLFFYDPDGGYVSAFRKDYGYEFYGWRGGVMVVKGKDGTLWSALTGIAFAGPQTGQRLERIPSLMTDWGHWLMLHPESTAYNLFDGKKYPLAELPAQITAEAKEAMGKVDSRLDPLAKVLGVEAGDQTKAYPLEGTGERACFTDELGGASIAVFWYQPTRSAVAFSAVSWARGMTIIATTPTIGTNTTRLSAQLSKEFIRLLSAASRNVRLFRDRS